MAAYHCSTCTISYPPRYPYTTCPLCLQKTERSQTASPITDDQAAAVRTLAEREREFERATGRDYEPNPNPAPAAGESNEEAFEHYCRLRDAAAADKTNKAFERIIKKNFPAPTRRAKRGEVNGTPIENHA